MARNAGQFDFYYNKIEQEKLVAKYKTTDKRELLKLIKSESLTNPQKIDNSNLTTKQKLEKVKLANETMKIWLIFKHAGFTLDHLEAFVNNGVMPFMSENPVFPMPKQKESKTLTLGTTINYTAQQIKQKDGILRCLRCNRSIPMRAYDFEQIDDFKKHVETAHGELNARERNELMELY